MSEIALFRLALLAGEALATGIALPALAFLVARAYPTSASRRRLVYVIAFAALLALPALAAFAPSFATITLPAAPASAAYVPIATAAPAAPPWTAFVAPGLILGGAAIWSVGTAVIGFYGLAAMIGLGRLRRCGMRSIPAGHGLPAGGYELRFSEDCPGPMTWGVVRPLVMLPWAALGWTPERLATVMRHELAHVEARDCLAQAMAFAACALYWPSPLVWQARRALRREMEAAADDAVIAAGAKPSDYAALLLELARQRQSERRVVAALAMAAPAALSERVQSILSPDAVRTGATTMDTLKLTLIGGMAAAALVAVRPSLAETVLTLAPDRLTPASVPPPPIQPAPAPKAAPAAPAAKPATPHHSIIIDGEKLDADGSSHTLSPEDQAELERQLAEIGPTVQKAIADAHIQETVAREVAAQQARTQAEVARQLAEIGPKIQKAMAEAHVEARVARSLADAQARIDAAAARASQRAAEAEARAKKAGE